MILQGKMAEISEPWEIFMLLIAAICHDTNHRGFNNIYNAKAETPLGILYKDPSVLEIHHIHGSIPIISRADIDLFGAFDEMQVKKVWNLFIKLILAAHVARNFELVKRAQAALDEGTSVMTDDEIRLLGLKLIMKVSDISNVSRPFDFANQWRDILNKEFFHQGDIEKQSGIGLTSSLNDRDTSNKPKSQIGFYSFMCLPLYSVVARLYPGLQIQVDAVSSNLEKWKELAN
jgi:3',5'-cyclic-nucleotide phosphodiesterase